MSPHPILKVLCSIDFSDFSSEVLAQAVVLAQKYGAELLVMNVVNEKAYEELERVSGRLAMPVFEKNKTRRHRNRLC